MEERLVDLAVIGNHKLSLAPSLLGTIRGIADNGKLSGDDRNGSAYCLGLNDTSAQLNLCWLDLTRHRAPPRKIKTTIDSVHDIRRKDVRNTPKRDEGT
jgi:hypothetical protein